MSSFRRIISSRANAALSTGPRTPAGKRRSSRNAIRHGCRARTPVILLENESRQDFDNLLQGYLFRFQPRNPLERACVDKMAAAQWVQTRLCALQTRMLTEAITSQPPGDDLTRTADAFLSLLTVPGFVVLSRYETTQDLNFRRAYRNLQDLRRRKAEPQGQPGNPQPADPGQDAPTAKRDVENKICTNEATLGFLYAFGAPHPAAQTRGSPEKAASPC